MPAISARMSTRSCSGISMPASRRRILPPRWCCRPIRNCASSRRRGSRMPARPVSAAVHQGIRAIEAGHAKIVLVVRRRTDDANAGCGDRQVPAEGVLICRRMARPSAGFAGVFGKIAQGYFQKYGDQSDALAMIAAKNHKNGVANPYAQMRKDFGFEFCRAESDRNPSAPERPRHPTPASNRCASDGDDTLLSAFGAAELKTKILAHLGAYGFATPFLWFLPRSSPAHRTGHHIFENSLARSCRKRRRTADGLAILRQIGRLQQVLADSPHPAFASSVSTPTTSTIFACPASIARIP